MTTLTFDLQTIDRKIRLLQQTAEELQALGQNFPALDRNIGRVLASLKMLRINISDATELKLIGDFE